MSTKITLANAQKCVNRPAWNSDSLHREKPVHKLEVGRKVEVDGIDSNALPENKEVETVPVILPVFALIRTARAIYTRAKIVHESREELHVSYITINRKGGRELKTDKIEKRDIRTLRIYQ
jgi:hypothetical protein